MRKSKGFRSLILLLAAPLFGLQPASAPANVNLRLTGTWAKTPADCRGDLSIS